MSTSPGADLVTLTAIPPFDRTVTIDDAPIPVGMFHIIFETREVGTRVSTSPRGAAVEAAVGTV